MIPWEVAAVVGSFDPIDHRSLELVRRAAAVANRVSIGLTNGKSDLSLTVRADLIRACTTDLGAIGIVASQRLPRAHVLVAWSAPAAWQEVADHVLVVATPTDPSEISARTALIQYKTDNPILALLRLRQAVPAPAYRRLLRSLPERSSLKGN